MYLYDFCLEMRHAYRIYEFFCWALSYLITGVAAPWVYLCDIWGRSVLHITTCSLRYQSMRNITTCKCNTMYNQGKSLWHWTATFAIKTTQYCYILLQCWYQLIKDNIPYKEHLLVAGLLSMKWLITWAYICPREHNSVRNTVAALSNAIS